MTLRGWAFLRATWLVLAVVFLSPVNPFVLVGVPLALLLLAFCSREIPAILLAAALLAFAFMGAPESGRTIWIAERGWALLLGGAFVIATLWRPRDRVISRSIYTLATVFGLLAVYATLRPSLLVELDWWVAAELRNAAGRAYDMLSSISTASGQTWAERVGHTLYEWADVQASVYPAFLALASVAALEVGWYVVCRFWGARVTLGPLREFRFSDQLVWVLVLGLALLVLPVGEFAGRVGENATLFMGALYLVRGVAVLVWVAAATITSAWTAALWGLFVIVLYPVVAGAAVAIGLSDTWLDLRGRLRRAMARGGTDS